MANWLCKIVTVLILTVGVPYTQAETEHNFGAVVVAGIFHSESVATRFVGCGATGTSILQAFSSSMVSEKTISSAYHIAANCALKQCAVRIPTGLPGECRVAVWSEGPRFVNTGSKYDKLYKHEILLAIAKDGGVESINIGQSGSSTTSQGSVQTDTTGIQLQVRAALSPSASVSMEKSGTHSEQSRQEEGLVDSIHMQYSGYKLGVFATRPPVDPLDKDWDWYTQVGAIRECGNNDGKRCRIKILVSSETSVVDQSEGKLFVDIVRQSDLDDVYLLLEHGYRPWRPSFDGWSALHEASYRGNLPALRALLGSISDHHLGKILRNSDGHGNTPLHATLLREPITESQLAIVEELLSHHAPVAVRNGKRLLPLHLAVLRGEAEVVRRILAVQGSVVSDQDLGHAIAMTLGVDESDRGNSMAIFQILEQFVESSFLRGISKKVEDANCRGDSAPDGVNDWWETDCGAVRLTYRPAGRNYDLPIVPGR